MSLSQSQRIEQRISLMLKQKLSLEMKQILKLILALLQTMQLEQRLDLKTVQKLRESLDNKSHRDLRELSHEVVRRGGIENAKALGMTMAFIHYQERVEDGTPVSDFLEALDDKIRHEERRRRCERRTGIIMAIRLVLDHFPPEAGGSTEEDIARLLSLVPQTTRKGIIVWALAGGWAVEMLTGERLREHKDIDTVLLQPKRPALANTDRVYSDDYFGVLACSTRFFRKLCVMELEWEHGGKIYGVQVARPEFLFLSKFLRPPRPKDWEDAKLLLRHFAATWDLMLIDKLIRKNNCGFERRRKLIEILNDREPSTIIESLSKFW